MGIVFAKDYKAKSEEELDKLIEAKQSILDQQKQEEKIRQTQEEKAAKEAKKDRLILKDVDGDDVEQSEYFWPREEVQPILNARGEKIGELPVTDKTAPAHFNGTCGYPVDREELIEEFVRFFPRRKGFLFYKKRDSEVYLVIVPRKYAKTISRANESRAGDFQFHAMSFINEGSVNIDSLRVKLERISKHTSISTEPIGE